MRNVIRSDKFVALISTIKMVLMGGGFLLDIRLDIACLGLNMVLALYHTLFANLGFN